MKTIILTLSILAAALPARAETYVQWNIQNVEMFRAAGAPIPPGMFDAVVVFASERVQLGSMSPTAFRVRVEFADGAIVETLAQVDYPSCRCAGARVPFPKGTRTESPRRISVTPVVFMGAAPVKEVTP